MTRTSEVHLLELEQEGRRTRRSPRAGGWRRALGWMGLSTLACSRFFNVDADQCSSPADCQRFGAEYACVSGLCEPESETVGTGGDPGAGAGGDSGDRGGGAAGEAGATTGASGRSEGGSPAGGNAGATGESGAAGEAGQAGASVVPCKSHRECFERHGDEEPFACVAGSCIALKTPECPLVLPVKDTRYNALKSSDAIVLGAFAWAPMAELETASQNFDLAVTELMEATNGIPAAGGKRRQVVMVVCHRTYATQYELLAPARHLIEELRVPGIVSTLTAPNLQYVFDEVGVHYDTFFMNTVPPDQNLLDLADNGLIWHMLSGPREMSVTYRPLLDMAITHQRNRGVIASGEDARVALVTTTDQRALTDIGNAVRDEIFFNGRTSSENSPENFLVVSTDALDPDGSNDPSHAAMEILKLKPHVIVSAASTDMELALMPMLETLWDEETQGQPRPFYLLSPYQYFSGDLLFQIQNENALGYEPPLHRRIAGINWAGAVDRTVYDEYAFQLETNYENVEFPISGENLYDGAYFLLYATAAAGNPSSGKLLADGMSRLVSGPPSFAVGRRDLNLALTTLHTSFANTIELIGSMGAPAFDLGGGRREAGAVYCINSQLGYLPDGLRYDPDSEQLTGTFPCWAFPALPVE